MSPAGCQWRGFLLLATISSLLGWSPDALLRNPPLSAGRCFVCRGAARTFGATTFGVVASRTHRCTQM
jgi:hypothetical protein